MLFSWRSLIKSSNCIFSSDTNPLAFSITKSSKPNLLLISKAFDLPGTPISNLYVGLSVSTSNSTDAFSTPGVFSAYPFNSL